MRLPPLGEESQISFTAKLVAYFRSRTDIPYAKDVSDLVKAPALMHELALVRSDKQRESSWGGPLLEARYKSLVAAIRRSGAPQVLEFASGVALRGLAMTQSDPDLVYVETDLPELTREKLRLIERVRERHDLTVSCGLTVRAANILSWDDVEAATLPLALDQPVTIVHEGLFMYLSHAEKDIAARHIHRILSRYGGVWVTPDFASMAGWSENAAYTARLRPFLDAIESRTGRPFAAAAFDDDEQIAAFCGRHGFTVTVRPQVDGSFALSSLGGIDTGTDLAAVEAMGRRLRLWEMRVAR